MRAPAVLACALLLLLFALTAAAERQPAPITVSQPVDWADCTACHPGSATVLPALESFRPSGLDAPIQDCLDCHDPLDLVDMRSNWTHPVRSPASHLPCTDCHVAASHDAANPPPRPTGDYNAEGCYACHREIEARRSLLWSHRDQPGMQCRDCHPAHEPLAAALSAELVPSTTSSSWLSSYDWWQSNRLCLNCHQPAGLILPLDEGFVTLNTVNYHDLHTGRGQVLCVECHDPHGSSRKGMLRDTLLSGNWLGYYERIDGGTCSVLCHNVDHDSWQYINRVY